MRSNAIYSPILDFHAREICIIWGLQTPQQHDKKICRAHILMALSIGWYNSHQFHHHT